MKTGMVLFFCISGNALNFNLRSYHGKWDIPTYLSNAECSGPGGGGGSMITLAACSDTGPKQIISEFDS